jgi:carbamoyltransferase
MVGQQYSISKPLSLGIHWAHDASVAICSPEGILCAIQEERITRIKHYYGFPCRALEMALKTCGLTADDIDILAFSSQKIFYPEYTNHISIDASGRQSSSGDRTSSPKNLNIKLLREKDKKCLMGIEGRMKEFAERHYSTKRAYLYELGLMNPHIRHYYIAHHRAHASSAFRLSGLKEACVITIDGKGDGLSATIYKGHSDGRMELLRSSCEENSLGLFYQAVTEALGFIPVDSEYKTMGLAALGYDNGGKNPFGSVVHVEDGVFKSSLHWTFRSYNKFNPDKRVPNPLGSVVETEVFKKLLGDMPREQFAYFAQRHCEENMLAYFRDAMRITGCNKIVCAGGVMLNVKANALIRDILKPSHFFVFPDASDSGLAAGAAMEALYQEGMLKKPARFYNPYMGHGFSDEEIYSEVMNYREKHGISLTNGGRENSKIVVDHLLQGKVIGTFQRRMEMGPRALGNRSVLADARSEKIKNRINLLLKGREPFVPFAPVILEEDANLYWDGPTDYRYMTFTVKASDYAKRTVPAVVHVDGSMRPQVVSQDFNPWLYGVLREYKKRTGVGALLNTSFNRHGLPIVGSPVDALDHLIRGWVDGLIIGQWYVERG